MMKTHMRSLTQPPTPRHRFCPLTRCRFSRRAHGHLSHSTVLPAVKSYVLFRSRSDLPSHASHRVTLRYRMGSIYAPRLASLRHNSRAPHFRYRYLLPRSHQVILFPLPCSHGHVSSTVGLELMLLGNQLLYWISLPRCLVCFSLPEGNNAFSELTNHTDVYSPLLTGELIHENNATSYWPAENRMTLVALHIAQSP